MLQSSSRALASEAVTEDLAGRAQGYMTTAHHTGFILGPSIGGLMIDYFSWRWSFFLLAPIGFGGMLLALMNMKRRQVAPQSRTSVKDRRRARQLPALLRESATAPHELPMIATPSSFPHLCRTERWCRHRPQNVMPGQGRSRTAFHCRES